MDNGFDHHEELKPSGRWAIAAGFFGLLGCLTSAAFANYYKTKMGIPTYVTYGLAGIGAATVLLLNIDVGHPSKMPFKIVFWLFHIVLAILTVIGSAYAVIDGGISSQSFGMIGIFVGIFVLTALCTWRMRALRKLVP